MSEPRVGEPSKRRKIGTTILGLIAAPVVTAVSIVVGMILVSLVTGAGGQVGFGGTSNNFTMLVVAAIYGGTVGLVPSILVGLPLHHYFVRKRWNGAVQYGVLGALAAALSMIIFMGILMVWTQGPNAFMFPGVYIGIAILSVAGIPGGLAFWIIRRPDRDAPPIPDDVFA